MEEAVEREIGEFKTSESGVAVGGAVPDGEGGLRVQLSIAGEPVTIGVPATYPQRGEVFFIVETDSHVNTIVSLVSDVSEWLFECPPDLYSMVDLAKIADLVLLMIDASYGLSTP